MDKPLPDMPRKGRGAVSNVTGRFEPHRTIAIDDGWGADPYHDAPPLRTTLTAERTKRIITRNDSPDVPRPALPAGAANEQLHSTFDAALAAADAHGARSVCLPLS